MGDILQALVAGVIIGPLARLVLPGKQDISLILTIIVGAVGAIVGDLVYGWLGGGETSGIDWTRWIVRVGVAAVAVLVVGMIRSRNKTAT